jgi:phospholipid N-methyltransferase
MPSRGAETAAVRSSSLALFARNFLKCPAMLGSVVPSSSFLVNDMMSHVDWERAHVLVEYGPGVGTFTREILKRMRPDAVLVAIELNCEFVEYLRGHIRDPRLRVVQGSAASVRNVLAKQGLAHADYIISSLPLRNMTDALRREILQESRSALKAEGTLLLFQYTKALLPYLESTFSSVRLNFQFFNILPALIFHCTP